MGWRSHGAVGSHCCPAAAPGPFPPPPPAPEPGEGPGEGPQQETECCNIGEIYRQDVLCVCFSALPSKRQFKTPHSRPRCNFQSFPPTTCGSYYPAILTQMQHSNPGFPERKQAQRRDCSRRRRFRFQEMAVAAPPESALQCVSGGGSQPLGTFHRNGPGPPDGESLGDKGPGTPPTVPRPHTQPGTQVELTQGELGVTSEDTPGFLTDSSSRRVPACRRERGFSEAGTETRRRRTAALSCDGAACPPPPGPGFTLVVYITGVGFSTPESWVAPNVHFLHINSGHLGRSSYMPST